MILLQFFFMINIDEKFSYRYLLFNSKMYYIKITNLPSKSIAGSIFGVRNAMNKFKWYIPSA